MFIKDGKLYYVYNFLGIPPEQRLVCDAPKSGKHIVGVEFNKESIGKNLEALGSMKLYVDDKVTGTGAFRIQTGHYALCGEGLCIGYDGGDVVSSEYKDKFTFTGGKIIKVVFDVGKDEYRDVEREFAMAMARD